MPRKLLVIAKDYVPQNSAATNRIRSFRRYLPEHGWEVHVLSAHTRVYDAMEPDAQEEPEVTRAFALDAKQHLSFRQKTLGWMVTPDRYWTWAWGVRAIARKLLNAVQPDAILSTFPVATAHAIGGDLAARSGLPWIADYRDPLLYPHMPVGSINRAARAIDRAAVLEANTVTFATEAARDFYVDIHAIDPARTMVIANGFEEEPMAAAEAAAEPQDGPFTFLHSGLIYGEGRASTALLDAFADAGSDTRLLFQGKVPPSFAAAAKGVSIAFRPQVPQSQALQSLFEADALVLIQGDHFWNQIPSKAYEYIRAKKPVLVLAHPQSATGKLFAHMPQAVFADPEDAACIRAAVTEIRAGTHKACADPEPYSRAAAAAALACLLDRVTKS